MISNCCAVTGGPVTGGAVTGGDVTGGAVTDGAVTGSTVTGGAVTRGAESGPNPAPQSLRRPQSLFTTEYEANLVL